MRIDTKRTTTAMFVALFATGVATMAPTAASAEQQQQQQQVQQRGTLEPSPEPVQRQVQEGGYPTAETFDEPLPPGAGFGQRPQAQQNWRQGEQVQQHWQQGQQAQREWLQEQRTRQNRQQGRQAGQTVPMIIVETDEGYYLIEPRPGAGPEQEYRAYGPTVERPQMGNAAVQGYGREMYRRGYMRGLAEAQMGTPGEQKAPQEQLRQTIDTAREAVRRDNPQQAEQAISDLDRMVEMGRMQLQAQIDVAERALDRNNPQAAREALRQAQQMLNGQQGQQG